MRRRSLSTHVTSGNSRRAPARLSAWPALIATAWLFVRLGSARADLPDVKSLFPSGAKQGTTVEVTVNGTLKPWPVRAYITGADVSLEPAKAEGKYSVVVGPNAEPGIRWIRFANDDGVTAARPFIVGALTEINEKEPNEDLPQATDVGSEPRVVNGTLAKGDKGADLDTFRVPLKKAQTLVAALDANRTLGSPIDGVLQIVSAAGFVLAQSHDELGMDPRIIFTAPSDGDYFVRVFGFTSVGTTSLRFVGDPTGVYRLTLTTGAYVDFVYPPRHPQASPLPETPSGWNLATVKSNSAHAATVQLPTATSNPDYHRSAKIVLEEPKSAKPQSITAPVVVAGRIDRPGDRDTYSLQVLKNQSLRIRVISQELAFPVDPLLKIESPDGTQLLRSDDGKRGEYDVDANYRAAADGEIRLVVEDLFGAGGERFVYMLDVRTVEPDFELALATSELYGRVGEDLEIPITIERVGGLADDIEIRLEGLPTEIGAASAVSMAKGDTAKKVTLKLKGAKTFTGAVRVVGTTIPPAPPAPKPGAKVDAKPAAKEPAKPAAPIRRLAIAKVAAVTGASLDEVLLVVGPAKSKK